MQSWTILTKYCWDNQKYINEFHTFFANIPLGHTDL